MGATWLQASENAALRFQHRSLEFRRARKRGEHHLTVACRVEGTVGLRRTLAAQRRGGLWAAVID